MYAVQYKANVIQLQDVPAEPRPGQRIQYTRYGRILTGVVFGTITYKATRYMVDGEYPTVIEYIVEVDKGQGQPWKFNIVHESDVVWNGKHNGDVCPRCGGYGHLAIVGDDDTPCPECGMDGEVTF